MTGRAVLELDFNGMRLVASGAVIVGRAVLETARIALAGIFVTDAHLSAIERGAGGGIMDVDELELRFDGIIA